MEARVESARRASEIHKKRTGRSLRVTEQDVINEEMYEEEDDDLPIQYRRLTQHLQTGSIDFNKRLSAYLTQHVAMRSALEQGIAQSYEEQPNGHEQYMYQNPLLTPQQEQQILMQQAMSTGHGGQSYPSQSPRMRASVQKNTPVHHRSVSIATPQELLLKQTHDAPLVANQASRRSSMPVIDDKHMSPAESYKVPSLTHGGSNGSSGSVKTPVSTTRALPPSFPSGTFRSNYPMPQYPNNGYNTTNFMNFSTTLPAESQQLIGNSLGENDPMTAHLMAGSNMLPQYDFNTNKTIPPGIAYNGGMHKLSGPQHYPTFDGLQSTLSQANAHSGEEFGMGRSANHEQMPQPSFFDSSFGDGGSGFNTPGAGEAWNMFMNDDKWDVPASQ